MPPKNDGINQSIILTPQEELFLNENVSPRMLKFTDTYEPEEESVPVLADGTRCVGFHATEYIHLKVTLRR
jgi:hypothetical protein